MIIGPVPESLRTKVPISMTALAAKRLVSFIGLSYVLLSIEFSSLFSILFSIERETAREIEQQTKLALALPP